MSPRRTRVTAKAIMGVTRGQPDWPVPENRCADVGRRCQKELPRPRGHQKEVGSDGLITS